MPLPQINAIANGVISLFSTLTVPLSLVSVQRARQILDEPVYISDARGELPTIRVRPRRFETLEIHSQQAEYTYEISLFYYRRQNVGEAHMGLLEKDVNVLHSVFDTADLWRPSLIKVIPNQQLITVVPVDTIFHAELKHQLDDDPNLRESVVEIILRIVSRAR